MGAVKIKTVDKYFSRCIRERNNWTCERCGSKHETNSMGLHCSHFHGRGKWATRFDPDNCFSLCYGCHSYLGGHPEEHRRFAEARLGAGMIQILQERVNNSSLGRLAKRSEAQIRKHYREELNRMKEARMLDSESRIEVENWY